MKKITADILLLCEKVAELEKKNGVWHGAYEIYNCQYCKGNGVFPDEIDHEKDCIISLATRIPQRRKGAIGKKTP